MVCAVSLILFLIGAVLAGLLGRFALSPGFGVRIFVSPVLVCEADRAPLQKGCIGGAGNSVVRDNDGIP
mgnify:CR=1 FL=1